MWRVRLLHSSVEKQQRAILAGNVMEWYDFTVYGYFAAVIGRQFFPTEDPISSLLAAFGVFAAGFLMRPFGSLVFGHIGDKMGRKVALTASVILMAVPTFLIGGLTPMVAVYTIRRSQDDLSPAFLLMAAAAVSFIVIAGLRETYRLALATPAVANTAAVARDAA